MDCVMTGEVDGSFYLKFGLLLWLVQIVAVNKSITGELSRVLEHKVT